MEQLNLLMKMPFLSPFNYFARQDCLKQNYFCKEEKISLPSHLIVVLGSKIKFWMDFLEGNWLFIAILHKKLVRPVVWIEKKLINFFSPFLLPGQTAALGLCPVWSSLQTTSATAPVSDYSKICKKIIWMIIISFQTLLVRGGDSRGKGEIGTSIAGDFLGFVCSSSELGFPSRVSITGELLVALENPAMLHHCCWRTSCAPPGSLSELIHLGLPAPLQLLLSSRSLVSFAFAELLRGWALLVQAFQGDKCWHRPCIANCTQ